MEQRRLTAKQLYICIPELAIKPDLAMPFMHVITRQFEHAYKARVKAETFTPSTEKRTEGIYRGKPFLIRSRFQHPTTEGGLELVTELIFQKDGGEALHRRFTGIAARYNYARALREVKQFFGKIRIEAGNYEGDALFGTLII